MRRMSGAYQTTSVSADDVSVTGLITVTIVLLVVVLFIAIVILYLRSKGTLSLRRHRHRHRSPSRRLMFAPADSAPRNALDRSILESLPVVVYRVSDGSRDAVDECAVCLCELAEGEEARFLPKCRHGYHVGCIDMWFGSNSSCPLCRLPVTAYTSSSSDACSSGKRELVIEVPSRGTEGRFVSPVSQPPVLEKLRSLGRKMSRGRGIGASSSTPTPRPWCDVEQGGIDASKRE